MKKKWNIFKKRTREQLKKKKKQKEKKIIININIRKWNKSQKEIVWVIAALRCDLHKMNKELSSFYF